MKTMQRFAVLAVTLSLSSSAAFARHPKPSDAPVAQTASRAAVPLVARDNFVSLSMNTSGGFANLQTRVVVQSGSISRFLPQPYVGHGYGRGGFGGGSEPPSSDFRPMFPGSGILPLSNNQLNLLLRAINEARIPTLEGKYEQKGLRDGINETVTLTISDEANRDRTFTIQNLGNTAPRAYYEFMARLRAFIALKLPEPAAPPQPQPAPAQPTPAQ